MSDLPSNSNEPTAEITASAFERVPQPLRRALEGRGFSELTPVQVAALDAVDGSRDLRISSQTGSGKTVALGLAISAELIASKAGGPRLGPDTLIIVPTRELASQLQKELEWLYAGLTAVRIDCVTGGTPVHLERRRLARKSRILVGTPGRLVDHIRNKALDCSSVKQLVLDEADQMLDMGFRDELEAILESMPAEGRRTHMLSATFPAAVRRLTERYQSNPLHVEGTRLGAANEDIAHLCHLVRTNDRYGAIVNVLLLANGERSLIFVATRAKAADLAERLAKDGFAAMPLSGDLAQAQRTRTLNAFKTGTVAVLVATDVAARGLDVPEVATVLHGDLPMDGEVYTHRSGRTGRAGRKGRSILLVTSTAQRRARRILADARVEAQWQGLPSAAEVNKALKKRFRQRLWTTLEEVKGKLSPEDLDYANKLLADQDPGEIVAGLISSMKSEKVREPYDMQSPRVTGQGQGKREREFGGGRERSSAPRRGKGDFTRFRINWGFRNGASPQRILATICRRGDVPSRFIGAIDIGSVSATFDVASSAAKDFERGVRKPDSRDPNRRIERVSPGMRDKPAPRKNARTWAS